MNRDARSSGYNIATPDRLLDAAERVFAKRHYSTVTLREIADEAGANVGQIVYHFARKDELIRRTILRRADTLNRERIELLRKYEKLVGCENVQIEPLVRAFLEPYFRRLEAGDMQWRCFAAFVGRAVWDGQLSNHMSESFDEATKLYHSAFRRALPTLKKDDAVRGFQFMLAVMHVSATNDLRTNALLGAGEDEVDYAAYHSILVPYIAGGLTAIGAHNSHHEEGRAG